MALGPDHLGNETAARGLSDADLADRAGPPTGHASPQRLGAAGGHEIEGRANDAASRWDKRARRRRPGTGRAEDRTTPSLSREDLLSVSEAADFLGVNHRTLYRLIDRGQVPGARRLGRTVVVVRPILERWLLTGQLEAAG